MQVIALDNTQHLCVRSWRLGPAIKARPWSVSTISGVAAHYSATAREGVTAQKALDSWPARMYRLTPSPPSPSNMEEGRLSRVMVLGGDK